MKDDGYYDFTKNTACLIEPYDDDRIRENACWHLKGTVISVYENINSLIEATNKEKIDFIICSTNQIILAKKLKTSAYEEINSVQSLFDDSYCLIFQRVDVFKPNTNEKCYRTVGTLGNGPNDVTCSMEAARDWDKAREIVAYEKFEYAADELKTGKIETIIIPCAYPDIRMFIMDKQLVVVETHFSRIPPLVFVSQQEIENRYYDILYNHPATNALIPEVNTGFGVNINVNSNTVACLEVLATKSSCCAITNELCAKRYGLHIHKYLREDLNMPFLVFANKGV